MPEKVAAEFDRFVEENYREIFGTAYRLSGSADDAADLTQETFKNVLGAMTGGSRPENARAYLLTTLKNVFFREVYRRRKDRPEDTEAYLAAHEGDELPLPEAARNIDGPTLQKAINLLAPDFRIPLVLFYYNGSSYEDIARIMNVPIGTVMSRLSRAKRHLKLALGKEAVE